MLFWASFQPGIPSSQESECFLDREASYLSQYLDWVREEVSKAQTTARGLCLLSSLPSLPAPQPPRVPNTFKTKPKFLTLSCPSQICCPSAESESGYELGSGACDPHVWPLALHLSPTSPLSPDTLAHAAVISLYKPLALLDRQDLQ